MEYTTYFIFLFCTFPLASLTKNLLNVHVLLGSYTLIWLFPDHKNAAFLDTFPINIRHLHLWPIPALFEPQLLPKQVPDLPASAGLRLGCLCARHLVKNLSLSLRSSTSTSHSHALQCHNILDKYYTINMNPHNSCNSHNSMQFKQLMKLNHQRSSRNLTPIA